MANGLKGVRIAGVGESWLYKLSAGEWGRTFKPVNQELNMYVRDIL